MYMLKFYNISERFKQEINESKYKRWILENKGMLLISILIAIFLTILTYPGIMYSDSYARIGVTSELKTAIHAFNVGNVSMTNLASWLTITPSFFILLSEQIVGSVVLYTFVQCFLLFLSTYIMGDGLTNEGHRRWNRLCITLNPVLWAFGVYYEASVGCVTAIMGILLLVWKWDSLSSYFDKIITIVLLIFSSYVCLGYRANAFTIIPILILIVILKERKVIKSTMIICSICIGTIMALAVPKALNIDTMSSYAGSLIWEMVSTIQSMDEEKQSQYITYLDDVFGKEATATAVANNSYTGEYSSINDIWWGNPFNTEDVSKSENTKKVLSKYIHLWISEPKDCLKVKWNFISHSLGINQPLRMAEYDYNRDNSMSQFGYNDCKQRLAYVDFFLAFMNFMIIFRIPWLMFTVALVLILIWRFKCGGKKENINIYEASFGIAVFYYGAYILNTQSFEFRYYFPSWLLLFLIIFSLSADLCFRNKILKKIMICLLPILAIVSFCGTYGEYNKVGDNIVKNITKEGTLLCENGKNYVYYLDGKLYFVNLPGADEIYTYFLHYFPLDGDMINSDFKYELIKIATSFWKNSVAVMDMPKQEVEKIEFGQYYGDTRFWERTIETSSFISRPKMLYLSDYTDNDWNCGYSNLENCFLINNLDLENYYIKGKELQLQDGSVTRITDVEEVAGYIRIYTDEKLDDVSVREYQVIE